MIETSEVVSASNLIEKDVNGESVRRETASKSSELIAEEILVKVDRHGNAR
jgi:hypothetical protein